MTIYNLLTIESFDKEYNMLSKCAVPLKIYELDNIDHQSLLHAIHLAIETNEKNALKSLRRSKKHLEVVK